MKMMKITPGGGGGGGGDSSYTCPK